MAPNLLCPYSEVLSCFISSLAAGIWTAGRFLRNPGRRISDHSLKLEVRSAYTEHELQLYLPSSACRESLGCGHPELSRAQEEHLQPEHPLCAT